MKALMVVLLLVSTSVFAQYYGYSPQQQLNQQRQMNQQRQLQREFLNQQYLNQKRLQRSYDSQNRMRIRPSQPYNGTNFNLQPIKPSTPSSTTAMGTYMEHREREARIRQMELQNRQLQLQIQQMKK